MPPGRVHPRQTTEVSTAHAARLGFYAAIATSALTVVSFAFAITALPISGPSCIEDCIDYPYLDALGQYPRDFLWMYIAIFLLVAYVLLAAAIHMTAPPERAVFSLPGMVFAAMSALTLLLAYFTHVAVVPIALLTGETEGLPLLIQYNPHGLFIALEELGYLLMSLSFLFLGLVLAGRTRLERAARWVFVAAFALTIIALLVVASVYGLRRDYWFEIAVISIDWLALIVNGVLLAALFHRRLPRPRSPHAL